MCYPPACQQRVASQADKGVEQQAEVEMERAMLGEGGQMRRQQHEIESVADEHGGERDQQTAQHTSF